MNIADDLEMLFVISAEIARREPEAIRVLNRVYQNIFGETIQQGCGNCYNKAYYRIQKYIYLHQSDTLNPTKMPASTRKYLLKPDRSLQTTFGGDTLTNDNLTDDAAEKLLAAHPSLLKHFQRYPQTANPVPEPPAEVQQIVSGEE